jgi:glycosyltransferase involved in cell wall biosynthesis
MKIGYEIFHYHKNHPLRFLFSNTPCLLIVWENEKAIGCKWAEDGVQSESIFYSIIHEIEEEYKANYKAIPTSSYTQLSLTVVICTRNRPESLARCLYQIQQSIDNDFEVIVVDNAPDNDNTQIVASNFPFVHYVREERKGLDIARNTGAKHASGTIIAYTDDDVVVDINWTNNIKKSFADPQVMAVTGLILPASIRTKAQIIFEKYWSFNKGFQAKLFDKKYFEEHSYYAAPVWDIGAGANMAFRKDTFVLNGFFDERLDVGAAGCSGDSEYWYRLLANGWTCLYNPAAIVFHAHRDSMQGLRKQLYHYMRGQIASLFVQYENYGHKGNLRRIYRALPLYYMERFFELIRGKRWVYNQTLFTEIAGAISGIFFYWRNKKEKSIQHFHLLSPTTASKESLVSIVITNYNYGQYVEQAITSCINQTHKTIEIIIADDGSTDNSLTIIKRFPTIKLIQTDRVKLSAARNAGVKEARGEYVIFLDADDYLTTNAIEKQLFFFNYSPEAVFVAGNHQRINEKDEQLPVREPKDLIGNAYIHLLEGNFIAMEGAVMYRKEIFDYFSFDINLQSCEDYDLNLRISRYFPCVAHSDIVAVYRIHNRSMSANKTRMWQAVQQVFKTNTYQIQSIEEANAAAAGLINWKQVYE